MFNILIADDNDANIYVLEMLIEEWFEENDISDFKIVSVLNGKKAVEEVETSNYDLIFLDIMMPVMDGFEALEVIRKMDLYFQPKVVVASAVIDDEVNKNKAKHLKANAFIVKPLSLETINIMLNKYLKNKNISDSKEIQNSTKYIYFDNENTTKDNTLNAAKFLNEYPSNIIDNDDIEELIQLTNNFEQNINFSAKVEESKAEFIEILEKYRIMLLSFTEFTTLNNLIIEMTNFAKNIDTYQFDNKSQVSFLLYDIVELLSNWIEDLFINKDLEDVFLINESISNSFTALKEFISKG